MAQNYYVVAGAGARFIGTPARVSWTGPGDAKVDAAIATQLAAGNLVQVDLTGGPGAFAATFLDGDLPVGDGLHVWTGDEFANSAQIKRGLVPPEPIAAVDDDARTGLSELEATVLHIRSVMHTA